MARTGGSSSRRVYSFLALSSLPLLALAQCECGYIVEGNRFTHGIVTDFSKFPDTSDIMDGSDKELDEWEVQEWGTSVTGQHGNTEYRLPRQNMGENVWIKGGTLHMRQNGYSVQEAEEELPVKVAEIVTRRNDILYGSFRSNFRVIEQPDAEGGSVAGFFFYFVSLSLSGPI